MALRKRWRLLNHIIGSKLTLWGSCSRFSKYHCLICKYDISCYGFCSNHPRYNSFCIRRRIFTIFCDKKKFTEKKQDALNVFTYYGVIFRRYYACSYYDFKCIYSGFNIMFLELLWLCYEFARIVIWFWSDFSTHYYNCNWNY